MGTFSQSPDTLGVFGLKAPRVAKRTVAGKSAAMNKVAARREGRHPMGPKASKRVEGTVPSANKARSRQRVAAERQQGLGADGRFVAER